MLDDLNVVQCQIAVLGKVHWWACRSEWIPLPSHCYPSILQDWAPKLGLLTWQCTERHLDNGLCRKHEAGPMNGVLPEGDAGLLLQAEV